MLLKTFGLTWRQHDVVCLYATGKTLNEIGQILKISERTVRYHLNEARSRMNVFNNPQIRKKIAELNYEIYCIQYVKRRLTPIRNSLSLSK